MALISGRLGGLLAGLRRVFFRPIARPGLKVGIGRAGQHNFDGHVLVACRFGFAGGHALTTQT